MDTISFLGLLAFTYLFTQGTGPVEFIKKLLRVSNESSPTDLTRQVIQKLINCPKCSGFWIGLTFYYFTGYDHYILAGCLTSIAAELFARTINLTLNKYLNKL
jgi:hypothetical protein